MAKTIIEKIIANHTKDEVKPGNIVWMDLDVRSARDFGGANVVKNFEKEFPGETVENPAKTFFTFDCQAPANTIPYATNQQICRRFANKHNIKVYDVDAGIGSHVLIDEGVAVPRGTVVGTDSHLNIMGAIGCFGQGMGDQDITFAFRTGKTWFEVPETIKINIKGKLKYPATPKDLILYILKNMGPSGVLGYSVEVYGQAIENLSLDGRITLSSMATEMGGIALFITPSDEILNALKSKGAKKVVKVEADRDANYSSTIDIDVEKLKPQASLPGNPANVTDVGDLKNISVDSVFIGSCTNGRMEDMEVVAKIVKGKKVKPNVMAKIVPATKKIYGELLKKGLIELFYDSGFIISNPGCGGCASGQIGMTGKFEAQLSTSNRNFEGKQGEGDTYLVSPAVAAISALTGKITSP